MKPIFLFLSLTSLCAFQTTSYAQTCNPNIKASTPTERFTLNTDGTAQDKKTGLIWSRCALGQTWSNGSCSGSESYYTWQDALKQATQANNSKYLGAQDWG